jgi:hypothetical protein
MRTSMLIVAAGVVAVTAAVIGAFGLWRRDPRIGSGFVNRVIDPMLVARGVSGAGRSEIGTLEHIGRTSGVRRLTPVHPVAAGGGFRVIVPLGGQSEWARNVLAAGHCRLQLHDVVHELDEPVLVAPELVPGLSRTARQAASRLGFRYLLLHTFESHPGSLVQVPSTGAIAPDKDVAAVIGSAT